MANWSQSQNLTTRKGPVALNKRTRERVRSAGTFDRWDSHGEYESVQAVQRAFRGEAKRKRGRKPISRKPTLLESFFNNRPGSQRISDTRPATKREIAEAQFLEGGARGMGRPKVNWKVSLRGKK